MELFLDLAGIRVRVVSEERILQTPGVLTGYHAEPGPCDYTFHVRLTDTLPQPRGRELFRSPSLLVYSYDDTVMRYGGTVGSGVESAISCLERRGGDCRLWFRRSALFEGVTSKLLLSAMEAEHLLTVNRGFLLHASYIEYHGRAILFTAPSETGKSTQAQLWCDHAGAQLVNGDRAAVRIMDGQTMACGIPFSGSSPVRRNVKLPLAAIVYLSQAPENSISRLRGTRAFRRVWEGCTVNVWDRWDVDLAMGNVTEVISNIPVFHLACTPDGRAVELLKHTLEVEA